MRRNTTISWRPIKEIKIKSAGYSAGDTYASFRIVSEKDDDYANSDEMEKRFAPFYNRQLMIRFDGDYYSIYFTFNLLNYQKLKTDGIPLNLGYCNINISENSYLSLTYYVDEADINLIGNDNETLNTFMIDNPNLKAQLYVLE